MVVVVIVLAVVAAVAIVLAAVGWSRQRTQRQVTESANAALAATTEERDASTARATDAETARDAAAAVAAEARAEAEQAKAAADEAHAVAEQARADADALRAAKAGVDPELLWTLEQARSERTWRQSVAIGPDTASVLQGADDPLREALQVELDAAREDVGAIVELDAELPPTVTAAGSVLVLRAAQELLARAVKAAEETTLRIRTDGHDVVVTVVASDEEGQPVGIEPLAIPESPDMAPADGGVRIRGAAASTG
jgi:hypothetical protein